MLPNGRRLGAHLPLGHGMVRAADRAAEIGASALQIFCDNPTAWRRRPTLPRELPAFRDRLSEHGIGPLSIHAPYLVNLAGADPQAHARSVDVLANELRVAAAYGARFVNVHIGSHRGEGPEAGIEQLARGVRRVMDRTDGTAPDVLLVLENGSGGGFGLGASVEELALIDEAVAAAGVPRERYAFCLDTAHLWGAGYPVDTPAGVDGTIAAFDEHVGLARLAMVHLNDSRSEQGSRQDRHEHVGAGRIGPRGLARMVTHPSLAHIAAYFLETPGMEEGYDAVNVARVVDLAEGRPLPDLPPAAFHTRSARGRSAPAEDDDDPATGP
jgi:deoxyribonuclease-4